MSDAYTEALRSLFEARRAGVDFGTERVEAVLKSLALAPPKAAVQIAGTNGKGSTAAMLAQILREAGYRVGVFSSPHLLSLCERFAIDGQAASREQVVAAHSAVLRHGGQELSFFERVTAMAVWIFAVARVEVAIYEVGLGGRLDSTTAIPVSLTAITGIGLDHCEFLGHSLEEIAQEKAGIFRAGVSAVIGLSAPASIRELLVRLAAAAKSPAISVNAGSSLPSLGLRGEHQEDNARLALTCARALRSEGLTVSEQHIERGLERASIAGRFEKIDSRLWIDAAHNGQAFAALLALMAKVAPLEQWVVVLALAKEKEPASVLATLQPCCALVLTQMRHERAMPLSRLVEVGVAAGARLDPPTGIPEPKEALAFALESYPTRKVLVTGSLLLLAEVLGDLGHGPADPLVLSDPSFARA